jgi:hypothetical protein
VIEASQNRTSRAFAGGKGIYRQESGNGFDGLPSAPKFRPMVCPTATTTLIKGCNRLGMFIDLAHANVQTTEAALKVTSRSVIISHAGLDTQRRG